MQDSQSLLQSIFKKSAIALQGGDYKTAKKGFEKVTKKVKNNPLVWYNLGLSNQYLNKHADAVYAYRKAIALNAQLHDATVNLAIAYNMLGQADQAVKTIKTLANSGNIRASGLMGSILAELGDANAARDYLLRAYLADRSNLEAQFNFANVEFSLGHFDQALELSTSLIEQVEGERKYRELQIQILISMKNYDQALSQIKDMEQRYGKDEGVLRLELALKEVTKAHLEIINIVETLLEAHPKEAALWNALGNAYFQMDSVERAKEYYAKAMTLDDRQSEYANNLGFAYSSLGDKEHAERNYRRALELNPNNAEAYRNLVAMRRYDSMDEDDVKRIVSLWQSGPDEPEFRMKLAFALGKIYDDCKEYDKSFEAYEIGNALKFAQSNVDLEKYLGHIDRIPNVLSTPPSIVSNEQFERAPIFVLGMPRSGTTLVEQILARHPDVTGCGELPCIERSILRLEKDKHQSRIYPDDFQSIDQSAINAEAREYQSWVGRLYDVKTPWFIDKMPFNFVHVWLIKALFPNSPIINCRRHPLDVILSNFFQIYSSDISFVYHLESLTKYYVRYYQLMERWNEIFENGIYNVGYEALVTDHEVQARQLVENARLEWSDECLDSKNRNTTVRTASIWQVRQGIYTRSKERWRNYESQLKPAAEILIKEGILNNNWEVVN